MNTAVSIGDVAQLRNEEDIFDVESLYVEALLTDPSRHKETVSRQGYFHPSAIEMCARRNVYEVMRAPITKGALGVQDLEIFDIGHRIHDRVQSVLHEVDRVAERKGLVWSFESEVPHDPTKDELFRILRIVGHTDGVLSISKPGVWAQRGLLEVKSMKDEYWQKLNEPKPAHAKQAHLYAWRFDCPIIYYWYYNKNNSLRKVFRRPFEKKIFDKAIDRIEMFNEHLEKGTLPAREESFYGCPRCEYKGICKPESILPAHKRHRNGTSRSLMKKAKQRFGRG